MGDLLTRVGDNFSVEREYKSSLFLFIWWLPYRQSLQNYKYEPIWFHNHAD